MALTAVLETFLKGWGENNTGGRDRPPVWCERGMVPKGGFS